ncbi:MAG: hypothetical protein DHS20C14_12960 [Phycisphaeraceae bacterium]|nr:MAG: hypothetical protein DHS20C14_12960 [Phycisphaeraceae bacterium]
MAQISARAGAIPDDAYHTRLDAIARSPEMREDNITLPDAPAMKIAGVLGAVGVFSLLLVVIGGFVHNWSHALAAFEIGLFVCTAASLGSLFLVMIWHSLNAGWHVTVRRQFENIASLIPFCCLGLLVVIIVELIGPGHEGSGVLLTWLLDVKQGDHLVHHKSGYLNPGFLVVRWCVYAVVWSFLALRLRALSREQDRTGNRWLSRKMRFMSGWGLLITALTSAFASFDFLMSMDYRFFSTMWGVYFFAVSVLAAVSLASIILAVIRSMGRLTGVVTEEHFHDLGKLVFAFTCFWAYISFGQYFLIWYSNIPEETYFFIIRTTAQWKPLFVTLAFAHFVVPFVLLVPRVPKRSTLGLGLAGVYMLILTIADLVWVIRPMVYVDQPWAPTDPGVMAWWLDAAGVIGVLGIFGALLVRQIASAPLVPTKDPMLHEALAHKNYV